MGAGKSTVGKKFANKLGWEWIDLDQLIEESEKRSIPDIFEEEGELAFREIEERYLKDLVNRQNLIVSTGGGTPCFLNNMDWMMDNGLTLYIKLPPGALLRRLINAKDKNARPLIKGKTDKELFAYIVKTLKKREEFYLDSEIVADGTRLSGKNLTNLAEEVYELIQNN